MPSDSLLARLRALESISTGFTTYTAGENIQSGKFVALIGDVVVTADASIRSHAGKTVGMSIESASAGDQVKVQQIGLYTFPSPVFIQTGDVFLSTSGFVSIKPQQLSFMQIVGTVLSPTSIYIDVDKTVILL